MTIEFHCPHCNKLLKTADDKAGVRANCPGCGEGVTVPDLAHETVQADPSMAAAGADAVAIGGLPIEPAEDSGVLGETKTCPMCGAQIRKAATKCRFCGESLVQQAPGVPTKIEAGEILSRTWEIYKNQFGLLIVASIVFVGIVFAVQFATQIAQAAIQFAVLGAAGGLAPNNPGPFLLVNIGSTLFFGFLNFSVNCYLTAGLNLLLLRVARGDNLQVGDIGEMFAGGRFFWRVILGNFLFLLMAYTGPVLLGALGAGVAIAIGAGAGGPAGAPQGAIVGFIIGVVAGLPVMIWVAFMFWPFMYVIVDSDVGVVESLRRSRELTSGNYLACFVLGLAMIGAVLVGFLALCVGAIFAIPLAWLVFAVAYCGMSGQLAMRRA